MSEVNLTSKLKDMEERISGMENKVKEISISVKERVKYKRKYSGIRSFLFPLLPKIHPPPPPPPHPPVSFPALQQNT